MLRHTGHSTIRASAIYDNDLEASGLPKEILESCGKQRRLVENWNDDGDHSRMVAPTFQWRFRYGSFQVWRRHLSHQPAPEGDPE